MFKNDFGKHRVCVGDTIKCVVNGTTYIARVCQDLWEPRPEPYERNEAFWPSLDPKNPGYVGENPSLPFSKQMLRARFAMRMYRGRLWQYVGIDVAGYRCGIRLTREFSHTLWDVEMNYPLWKDASTEVNEFHLDHQGLVDVANELLHQCQKEAEEKLGCIVAGDA